MLYAFWHTISIHQSKVIYNIIFIYLISKVTRVILYTTILHYKGVDYQLPDKYACTVLQIIIQIRWVTCQCPIHRVGGRIKGVLGVSGWISYWGCNNYLPAISTIALYGIVYVLFIAIIIIYRNIEFLEVISLWTCWHYPN